MCVNGAGNEKFNVESTSLHCSAHCQTEQQRICLVYRRELNKKNLCWSIVTTRVNTTRLLFTCSGASCGYSWILDDNCQFETVQPYGCTTRFDRLWTMKSDCTRLDSVQMTKTSDISRRHFVDIRRLCRCHFACILTIRMHVEEERWCTEICIDSTKWRENYNKN